MTTTDEITQAIGLLLRIEEEQHTLVLAMGATLNQLQSIRDAVAGLKPAATPEPQEPEHAAPAPRPSAVKRVAAEVGAVLHVAKQQILNEARVPLCEVHT